MHSTRLQKTSDVSNVLILKNAFWSHETSDKEKEKMWDAWRYSYKTKQRKDALRVMCVWYLVLGGKEEAIKWKPSLNLLRHEISRRKFLFHQHIGQAVGRPPRRDRPVWLLFCVYALGSKFPPAK